MKVTHLITNLEASGAEGMLTRLVSAPDQENIQHRVISMLDEGKLGPQIEAAGIPVHCLRMQRGVPSITALFRCAVLLEQHRPDVLMTWLYHADFMGLIAGRWADIPRIYWNIRCSNMEMKDYSWLSRMMLPILAKFSKQPDGVVVNSQAGRVVHETLGYRPQRWHLISNGIDLARFQPRKQDGDMLRDQLGLPTETLLVGNVARFDPMKDHKTLLQAWRKVAEANTNCHLVMIGRNMTDENRDLMAIIDDVGMKDRLSLLGERSDIPDLLPSLDLLVSSSAYGEGFPNVLGEAMACGVPCIATDVGDSARIIDDPHRVVPPRRPDLLVEAIERFFRSYNDHYASLRQAVRDRAISTFDIKAIREVYAELFKGHYDA